MALARAAIGLPFSPRSALPACRPSTSTIGSGISFEFSSRRQHPGDQRDSARPFRSRAFFSTSSSAASCHADALLSLSGPCRRRRAPARVPQDRRDGAARRAHGEPQGQEPAAAEEVQWHGDEAQAVGVLLRPAALRRARRRPQQEDPLLRQHPAEVHLRRAALQHRGGCPEGWGGARQGVRGAGHI